MRIRLSLYRRTPSFHSLYGLLWWTAFVWSGIGRGYAFFCPQPNDKGAMSTEAKPFLKWAGGKGQLLMQLSEHLPEIISKEPFTYVEPFVGGGAMLFYMLQHFSNIRKAVINDVNEDLILTYRIIKDDVEALISNLNRLEKDYFTITDQDGRSQIFYEVRERYNQHIGDSIERASQLIFLNKTCFNGLYRVNRRGQFNVPFGKYANPIICKAKLLRADSQLLQCKPSVNPVY